MCIRDSFNGPRLFGEVDRLFEQPGGDMLPARLAGAFPTLQVGVLPVSYTHLDVYKRQDVHMGGQPIYYYVLSVE